MIRVFSDPSPLSTNLNSFHKTAAVSDGKFAINSASLIPPTPSSGVFGVSVADPQPTFYPTNTTFYARVSASKPLTQNLTVGSAYFIITPGFKSVNNVSIQGQRGYSGGINKVYRNDTLPEFPLDPSLFVDPPRGIYYLRLYDDFDNVVTFQDTDTLDSQRFVAVAPASLGLDEGSLRTYRGTVRRIRIDVEKSTIDVKTVTQVSHVGYYTTWGAETILANKELVFEIVEAA
jgi:hypothetical protein